MMSGIVLIVPAHNEEMVLAVKMRSLEAADPALGIIGVVVAENGSHDGTLKLCEALKEEFALRKNRGVRMDFVSIPTGDMGKALVAGLEKAATLYPSDSIFLTTASDLPFGFSDIANFRKLKLAKPTLVLGSKGHPDSILSRSLIRRLMSEIFRWIRLLLLGLPYRDTQGTTFIPMPILEKVLPSIRQYGFFFTTEFVFRTRQFGFPIAEIPVVLRQDERKSSVHWFRTSMAMLLATLRLATIDRGLSKELKGST